MSSTDGILFTLAGILRKALGSDRASRTPIRPRRPDARVRTTGRSASVDTARARGMSGATATLALDPDRIPRLRIAYALDRDGAPDAGEVIWTWVPYEEGDGRGKDRPVLVIGRQSADRVYAVRMTSGAHEGDRDFVPIGSGAWDAKGRTSWVDVERLYSVHDEGLRREAAMLDSETFHTVAAALGRRYGWRSAI